MNEHLLNVQNKYLIIIAVLFSLKTVIHHEEGFLLFEFLNEVAGDFGRVNSPEDTAASDMSIESHLYYSASFNILI